jgi:hypothetical protein
MASTASAGTVDGQPDAGILASIEDGRIDTRYLRAENRTEVSLALAPLRPDGGRGVTLVLRASFAGHAPDRDEPVDVSLRAHYGLQSDDAQRAVQAMRGTQALEIHVDPHMPDGITLFFFPESWGYPGFTGPGDEIPVAFFNLTAAELRALAVARSLSGRVLWSDFVLTPAQLEALASFASQVLPD